MGDLLFSLTEGGDEKQDGEKKFQGLATGVVKGVADPLCLGRVQVAIDALDESDPLPWARVAVPMADRQAGHYFIPREGARVLVGFENGDMSSPYVLGCLWDLESPPPQSSPLPEIFGWRSPNGNQIVMAEKPASITLQTAPTSAQPMPSAASSTASYHTVMLSQSGVQLLSATQVEIKVQNNVLTVGPSGITLQVGNNTLSLTSSGLSLNGSRVTIAGSGGVSISGSTITLN